jgi:hypothetical protein
VFLSFQRKCSTEKPEEGSEESDEEEKRKKVWTCYLKCTFHIRISLFTHSPNQLYKLEEMSSCDFNLSRENIVRRSQRRGQKTAMRMKSQKRFELVISNVLFTSVGISLFTHSLSSHSVWEEPDSALSARRAINTCQHTCALCVASPKRRSWRYLLPIVQCKKEWFRKEHLSPVRYRVAPS